jgi:DNA-binding CsgD family transcriptional regulator/tetratricopeptide (TPR) repeat protein
VAERVSSERFVGREAELATLRRLAPGPAGGGGTAVIRGDAGVGKTRLVTELAANAAGRGVLVARGACLDLSDAPLAFGPVVEVLRDLVAQHGTDEILRALGPAARDLARLVPSLGLDNSQDSDDASRARLFETVRLLVERVAAERPVLLVVEDIHWTDRSTRDLLAFLVGNLPDAASLVLTFRSDELPAGHWLRQFVVDLGRRSDVTTIELAPFTRAEVAVQLTDIVGAPADPALVRAVWTRSEGNPFFAEELAALARNGPSLGLPPTLHELLLGRVASFSSDGRRVVGLAAVGGRRVSHRLLAAVATAAGVDDDRLSTGLREATDRQVLVIDGDGYAFRHALLQEAVYEELLPGERISLHARYGEILDQRPGPVPATPSDVARHWFLAGNATAALRAAVVAARASETACGFAEAQQHLEHAILLWEHVAPDDRPDFAHAELLEWRARVAHVGGAQPRPAALTEIALANTDDDVTRALALERLGRYLWAGGDGAGALEAYGEAVALVPAGNTPERARVLGTSARGLMFAGRHVEARELAAEAAEIARHAKATTEEGRAISVHGFTSALLGDVEAGLAMLAEARRLGEMGGDPNEIAEAYLLHVRLLSGPLCRLEEALAVANEGMARIVELGLDRDHGVSMQALIADTLFRAGRWTETDELLDAAIERDPAGVAAVDLYLARSKLAVGRGSFAEARDDLARALMLAERSGGPTLVVPRCTLEAGLALWQGNLEQARLAVDEGLDHLAGSDDPWLLGALVWHGLRTEANAAVVADDLGPIRERCEALAQHAAPLRSATGATTYEVQVRTYAAMCDAERAGVDGDDPAARWAEVIDSWDALGQPYPAAYARWKHAEALLAAGRRPPEARSLLVDAHRVAVRLGARPLQDGIERLASRARIELGDTNTSRLPSSGLTSREEQVLELVSTGATNREIASVLYISEKTVSVHVSNILAKLGARSRTEAAGLARQLGLTSTARDDASR